MGRLTPKIPPFEYLKGRELTSKLKEVAGVESDLQLADVFGVPKGTISTWHQRDLTPYELILRAALAYGVNIEAVALGKGDLHSVGSDKSNSEFLKARKLVLGKLVELEPVTFDKNILGNELGHDNCMVIFSDTATYLINTSETSPTSGDYLIDIDGVYSVNKIRRLPGKKLAIDFDGSLIEVTEEDIHIVGRIAIVLTRG
ncbi:helix-turn-helix domain-containing protein [Enterovibrio norvegicus]|uniref:helix-turn-helix domain-containing protein n=1 Tax=Enterovibrio norvegicus TaxID=188144 RepID=UPI000C822DC2|nr:helix-turn-helix domain-containing protein [Enterovibrio norvegicus]PMH69088.1 hypothetical protein BCU62_25335 [Enterovibrio norvegicus]